MKRIDVEGIGRFKSDTFKGDDRHQSARIEANDGLVDVTDVGNEGFRFQLAGFELM
ncbi:hypothetical protein D3C87_1933520 [compost metagenome]